MLMYILFPTDGATHTKMTILIQVAFYGAMHKMLKGAYNSGKERERDVHVMLLALPLLKSCEILIHYCRGP